MLYSKLFGKTSKEVSKAYESKNHELLTKAGFINQESSGIFSMLPMGKKILLKIENIVRDGLNEIGCQEVQMPTLITKANWERTDRWNVDIVFKTKSRYGQDYGLGFSHEEIVTPLAKKYIRSYKDLPLYLYHITPKFRDEARPKSGILRGREFGMKDLYSFHTTFEDFKSFYKVVIDQYLKIFKRLGFRNVKITEASGGTFTKKHSHEFNVITEAGEVDLIYCNKCSFAQNEEISNIGVLDTCPKCKKGKLKKDRAIEIGNIFDLGEKFSQAFDFKYIDKSGHENYPFMGCYGIGTTRILGAIVETSNDEKGIIWPESVAPYKYHLISLDLKDEAVKKQVNKVYKILNDKKIEVLFDDREDVTAGEKFADADLIGIPYRLVVSKRTGVKIEIKKRVESKTSLINLESLS